MVRVMEARELRIGNYYDQFGFIHQVNPSVIEALSKAPQSQLWCKPIPLTEEWLLKLGFEKTKREVGHEDDTEGKYTLPEWQARNWRYYTRSPWFCLYEMKDGGFTNVYSFGDAKGFVRTVHQLQNLYYALTGTELEIK